MMNKNILKLLAAFTLGSCVGFLVAKKALEEKYASLAQEEIDSVKERFSLRDHAIADIRNTEDTAETVTAEEIIKPASPMGGSSTLAGTRTDYYNRTKQNYNLVNPKGDLRRMNEEKTSYEDVEEEEIELPEEKSIDLENPYIIDESNFSEEFLYHDKITLEYYAEDDTLIDEDESIIDDRDQLIGYETLDMKNTSVDHPHTIYVRNERLGSDYEININLGSYQEQILGISMRGLSPREQQEKRTKMRKIEEDDDE